jgi:hypothetical protein
METSKISPNVMNLAYPRGRVSFAPFDDNGVNTGEIDLGNVTSFDLTNAVEYKEHMTSHDSVVVLDAKKPSSAKWSVKFAPDELSAENMALFFLADPDKCKGTSPDLISQTKSSTTLSGYVRLDRWVDLGKKYIKPGSIVATPQTGSPVSITELVSGSYTNYAVDYENGLVMLKTAGGLTDGNTCSFAFKYGTVSLKKFVHRIRPMVGFLRYRGLSEQGPRHSVECWKVQIHPDSPMTFIKPSDYAVLGFTGDLFIDDDTNAHRASDPFFKVAELDTASSYPS